MDTPILERLYDQKTGVYSNTLVFLLIPVIAVLLYLLYLLFFRNRKYFLEHLVIATHFSVRARGLPFFHAETGLRV